MKTTGQIIKMLRNEKRYSQAKLADALDISKSSIAMYETDERMPKTAAQLARHGDTSTTMDIYTEVTSEREKEIIEKAFGADDAPNLQA